MQIVAEIFPTIETVWELEDRYHLIDLKTNQKLLTRVELQTILTYQQTHPIEIVNEEDYL